MARVDPVLPDDKEQLWQQAGERMKEAQTEEGRRFYRTFIRRFPQDPRASRATLEIGLSLALEQQYCARGGAVPERARQLPALARGARGDVAALAGVRAAALLQRRARAARRPGQALPEVAAGARGRSARCARSASCRAGRVRAKAQVARTAGTPIRPRAASRRIGLLITRTPERGAARARDGRHRAIRGSITRRREASSLTKRLALSRPGAGRRRSPPPRRRGPRRARP